MKNFLSLSVIFVVWALAVCCKSDSTTQSHQSEQPKDIPSAHAAPSPIQTPEAGTLTAYYATEDFGDTAGSYHFKKGELICDDNYREVSVLDYDADNYKFAVKEAEDGIEYGSFLFPKHKAEKKIYKQNQLTKELIGNRAVFKADNGNTATVFKSNINGQFFYVYNYDSEQYEQASGDLQNKLGNGYVLSVFLSEEIFEEPLTTNGEIIELYTLDKDAVNPRYYGDIEDVWINKGEWDYTKSAYDEKGNLLTSQERSIDIPMSHSVAYIGELDALYIDGILFYRVRN